MTKADELLAKMRPLPCAECGKRTLSEHICVVSELSNEVLADRLDDIIPGYTQDEAQWPALKEAAKRLRNIPNCEDCQITAELRELLIECSPVTGTFKTPEELASHLKGLK